MEPAGILPLFQEEVSEVHTISPTVRRTVPAELTPSVLLAAAETAYSPASQTYRGSCLPTWNPNEMVPTPVRLPMFQHPTGKGWGHEPVGTNRKRLGDRAGPLGQTRLMPVPPSPVAYIDGLDDRPPLRVRKKTLTGSMHLDGAYAYSSWIEKCESHLSLPSPQCLWHQHEYGGGGWGFLGCRQILTELIYDRLRTRFYICLSENIEHSQNDAGERPKTKHIVEIN